MDFVCNTSSEIEKKVSTKSKEQEEAKARMIQVYYHFHYLYFFIIPKFILLIFNLAGSIRTRIKSILEKWRYWSSTAKATK